MEKNNNLMEKRHTTSSKSDVQLKNAVEREREQSKSKKRQWNF